MCPVCIGSALLVVTGASSAGGLAVIVARAVGAGTPAPRVQDPQALHRPAEQETPADGTSARDPNL
jgi:hypothetical protein